MNCTKLLLSLLMSITTISASGESDTAETLKKTRRNSSASDTGNTLQNPADDRNSTTMTLQRIDNNDPFANIPFVTTARGANHKQNDSSEQSTISLPTTHQNNVGFNNTFSPGANGHQANPFETATSLSLFSYINKNTNHTGFNDNAVTPGANGHQANPFATLTDNEQFQVVYSNQTLSGVNSGNMLKPQNANNRMGSDSNEELEKESSTDGSSKQLTDTGHYNGFSLANDVKNNKSQNDDLDDNNDQASAAPTNSPKANNEHNEK